MRLTVFFFPFQDIIPFAQWHKTTDTQTHFTSNQVRTQASWSSFSISNYNWKTLKLNQFRNSNPDLFMWCSEENYGYSLQCLLFKLLAMFYYNKIMSIKPWHIYKCLTSTYHILPWMLQKDVEIKEHLIKLGVREVYLGFSVLFWGNLCYRLTLCVWRGRD